MASTLTKANQILFKHGLQTNLDKMRTQGDALYGKATPGAFYLTSDTHRLYVGNDSGLPVPVNEGIVTYANLAAAQAAITNAKDNAGQFIFLTQEGILAVSNGKEWVQINNNTNTIYKFESSVGPIANGTVTVKGTLSAADENNPTSWEEAGVLSFTIAGENGIKINLADKTVKVVGPDIIAKATEGTGYANSKAEIGLVEDGVNNIANAKSKVTIKGSSNVNIKEDTSGAVVIEAKDTVLDGVTDRDYKSATGFTVVVKDTAGESSGGKIDPIITLDDGDHHFENGKMELPVYTKDQVDAKVKDFNAMEYKGVFPTGGNTSQQLSSLTGVKNGDTYKAKQDLSASTHGVNAKSGDLIIAQGTEVNGAIPSGNITWEVIPSGDEDTTYSFKVVSGGVQLIPSTDPNEAHGELKFAAGDKLDMTQSPTTGDGTTITFKHETTTRQSQGTVVTDDPQSGVAAAHIVGEITINSIDAGSTDNGIETDTTGHVTKVVEKIWKFKDTTPLMDKMGVKASASANMATVTLTPQLELSNGDPSAVDGLLYVQSDNANLEITASDAKVSLDLVWGTF